MSENLDATSAGGERQIHLNPTETLNNNENSRPNLDGNEETRTLSFSVKEGLRLRSEQEIEGITARIAKSGQNNLPKKPQSEFTKPIGTMKEIGNKIDELRETRYKYQRRVINGILISAAGLISSSAAPAAIDFLTNNPILMTIFRKDILVALPILVWTGTTVLGAIKTGYNTIRSFYLNHQIKRLEKKRF